MNAASIDKLTIIDNSFIQSNCKAPYLTSNTAGNLPVVLATFDSFTATYNNSGTTIAASTILYKTPTDTVNPALSSNTSDGYKLSSSTPNDSYKAFDNSDTTVWSSAADTYTSSTGILVPGKTKPFITIQYPSPVFIKNIKIVAHTNGIPKKIYIYGCKKSRDNSLICSKNPIAILEPLNWTNELPITTSNLYDGFKIEFETVNTSNTSVSLKGIIIKTQSAGDWSSTIPSSISDINFSGITGTGAPSLLILLNNLRICYNLLHDLAKFSAYKAQKSLLTVDKYSMNTSTFVVQTANLAAINSAMNQIFQIPTGTALSKLHPDKTNFYAVKRLLKAYEYIIHLYIAMSIENPSNPTPNTELILNKLNDENNSMSDKNYGYSSMQKILDETTQKYNNRLGTIDNLDIQLEDLKHDVVKEKTNKTTNSNILNKNTVVYYVFLFLFILLACVLLYALQKKDDEQSKIYVGGVLATSIMAMIIIYFLNMTYLKEGFGMTDTVAKLNLDTYIETYLRDTVNIALLNKNDRTFNSVLHVVNKEIDRYDGINKQLKLEAAGTNDVQVDDYRNARVLQYRVYLLLQIIIIVSVAMYVYLYTGENILLFGIVLLLLLLCIYIYIMNTQSMVHTDATKIYWGQPSIIN